MKLIKVTEKFLNKYEDFVKTHALSSIHQSYKWADFQKAIPGRGDAWILAVLNDRDEFLASALIYKNQLPFNLCWLYSPRGPLIDFVNKEAFEMLLKGIEEIARQEKAVFLRIDPLVLKSGQGFDYSEKFLHEFKFKKAHAEHQPSTTLKIDLTQSLDEILKGMKQKGRYNIKVAEKNGVSVRKSELSEKDFHDFYGILAETGARDGFSIHDKGYYMAMMEKLEGNAAMYVAEIDSRFQGNDKKIIAGIIVTYFGNEAIYYFGASSKEYRNLMAPYLLQWTAIKDAKDKGMKVYDFLGIAPEGEKGHRLAGVSEFKLKFGGKVFDYMKAKELVYKKLWYFLIKIMKKFK